MTTATKSLAVYCADDSLVSFCPQPLHGVGAGMTVKFFPIFFSEDAR